MFAQHHHGQMPKDVELDIALHFGFFYDCAALNLEPPMAKSINPSTAIPASADTAHPSEVHSFDSLPAGGYIRQAQLIPHVVPFSPATLWRKCKSKTFPSPVKLSDRVTAWRVGDVRKWLDLQAAA